MATGSGDKTSEAFGHLRQRNVASNSKGDTAQGNQLTESLAAQSTTPHSNQGTLGIINFLHKN